MRNASLRSAALLLLLAASSPADVILVHWSDVHCGAYDWRNTFRKENVEDMNTLPDKEWPEKVGGGKVGRVDFVISTGDITEHGTDKEWDDGNDWIGDDYLSLRKLLKFPSYECMGNHDCHKGGAEAGIKKLHNGSTYYSFDKGGVHFVSLDQYVGGSRRADNPDIDPPQLDWLEKDLKKINKGNTPVVLFMHSPPIRQLGVHWTTIGDSVERMTQILDGHKALILHGHWHKSMRNRLKDWWVLGAGTSMNPKYTTGGQVNEYNVIRLTNDKITCVPYNWVEKQWKPDGLSFLNRKWKKATEDAPEDPPPPPPAAADPAAPAAAPAPNPEADRMVERARNWVTARVWGKALEGYREVVQKFPGSSQAAEAAAEIKRIEEILADPERR